MFAKKKGILITQEERCPMPKKILLLFGAVLLVSSLINAQAEKTGAINGVVFNAEGRLLPGVTVILESPAIVVPSLETITNENGRYRFVSLPPGECKLIFSLPRVEKVVRSGIQLPSGITVTVNVNMTLRTTEEFIVGEGQVPTSNLMSAKGVTFLDSEFLRSISFLLNLIAHLPHM